ncbi:TRNA processing endoribonuclease Trz1 [Spironucleus salmonicida]|uniref:ribonuclease Z n=1 Tax=Spironucleus salmonicida TaxID=348837 RepID=V6LWR1_9EUKA|nr:TRNA processing endoribonuclease Trz1 [Spironucleus salmonicida]|eukprot:EST45234.1 tRNA processing endoribonuclease Trz1 [Spironucleus salmonicida]
MKVKTNCKVETTVISSGTMDSEFSLLVTIHNQQILINTPPGSQRFINAYNKKCGLIRHIIINSSQPKAVEGLLGLIMTAFAGNGNKPQNMDILSVEQPIVQNINSCAYDLIYDGKVQYVNHVISIDQKFNQIILLPYFESFITIIKFNVELEKLDKQKLALLQLNKLQLKQLIMTQQTVKDGITINTQDVLQELLGVGTIIVIPKIMQLDSTLIQQQIQPYLDEKYLNYIYTPVSLGIQNSKEYLTYQNLYPKYYPISDFSHYYYFQNNQTLYDLNEISDCQGIFSILFPHFSETSLLQCQENKQLINQVIEDKQFIQIDKQEPNTNNPNTFVTLGTGASVPNKYNNVTSVFVSDKYLLDAGESTLQQMIFYARIYNKNLYQLFTQDLIIIITHEHADHFLGVTSIIQLYFNIYNKYPQIIANPIVFAYIESILAVKLTNAQVPQNIELIPVTHSHYSQAVQINCNDHSFYFSGDCIPQEIRPTSNLTVLHEATFQDCQLNEAVQRNHSTISGALEVILRANGTPILTHFSQRYARDKIDCAMKAQDLLQYHW